MRIQKSVSHRSGGKEYVKHQIVIPNEIVTQLRWNHGDHVEARITPKGLWLYKTQPKPEIRPLDYEEFKEAVVKALAALPEGCVWSELRKRASFLQATPSPIWVRRLEDEKCLKRIRDPRTFQVTWHLGPRFSPSVNGRLDGWIIPKRE